VETRSNYVMVGAVTLALLAGMLLFIVWLAGLSNKSTK
jgi:phospholipid/cholesterol/gamma-HCH transport system substrate-binding protein